MDDYEYNDTPCPKCGHAPTHSRPCQGMNCDEGYCDEYEDDPINFAPGEEYAECPECHGTGYEHWCPKCGHDLTLPNIHRWDELDAMAWPSAVKFVSVEPMLGPVSFTDRPLRQQPKWVIAGPETGPRARPCSDSWIDALAAESSCFFDKRTRWTRREFPEL